MFTAIEKICIDDPHHFLCILIDEVESIANSRESSMSGEAQDSLRATNALLTGLDRVKKYCNLIILCTSNIVECLDGAFLDRCSVKRLVNIPTGPIKYEILRNNLHSMIRDGIITSCESTLPSCQYNILARVCDTIDLVADMAYTDRDAVLQELDLDDGLLGSKLLHIVRTYPLSM